MIGPIVNAAVVIVCSLAGCFLIRGIPERFEDLIKKAIGLSIVFVGIKGAMDGQHLLLLIMSMVSGAVIGEFINIDKWMNRLGDWAEKKLGMADSAVSVSSGKPDAGAAARPKGNFSKGFVSASIIFCTGSMAIVGSMQSGLQGNHDMLFAKSILDGSISLVFGASLGIGTAFSALPVLLFEGAIVLGSLALRDLLTPEIIREMSAAGSLLIAGIGFNFLGVKEIKAANLIPAIFIPWAYFAVMSLVRG